MTGFTFAARTLLAHRSRYAADVARVRGGIIIIGLFAGTLALPPRAAAQDGTIEQLVATALERSPEIRAARTAVAVAGGQLTQAGLKPNPMLTGTQLQMTGTQHQTLIGIEWPLDLFRRSSRVAVATRSVEATSLSVRDRERTLAAMVREQAGRLLGARRTVEIMNESLTAAGRMRELLDQRVSEGDTPKLDANIAAVEVGRMEADLVLAQAEADGAAIELKALVGLPADAPLVLRDTLESLVRVPPDPATPAQPMEATLAARPDVREATARVALAGARLEAARREGRVDMTLSGAYAHEFSGFAQRGFNDSGALVPIQGSFDSVVIGARLTLPIRNKNQGGVAAALAERTGEEEVRAARQLTARAELDAALLRDREALRAVEMYATTIRQLARQNVDVQLEAYDLGRTPLSDLLTEQRRYLDVEAAYTAALSRAFQAQVALRRARGEIR
jgi:cobalt-zinc-cadmium efflux system outer membrane protein